jgi:host factor-I protein
VVLETNNQEQLVFKHAISTVVMARAPHLDRPGHASATASTAASPAASVGVPAAPVPSTPQG